MKKKSTQKKSIQKSASKKSIPETSTLKMRAVHPVTLCILVLVGIISGGYLAANAELFFEMARQKEEKAEMTDFSPEEPATVTDTMDTQKRTEEITEHNPAQEITIMEEQSEGEKLRSVQMGEDIFYTLYEDGSLWITGTGYIRSFEDANTMTEYLMEQFDVKRSVLKREWFHAVTSIVIGSEVTAIENCALALYVNVKEVSYRGTMEFIDENAFQNCGAATGEEIHWDVDFTETKIFPGAFNGCLNPPAEYGEPFLPE